MTTAADHSARLNDLRPEYERVNRHTWFAQWYERNELNLRWLLDDRIAEGDRREAADAGAGHRLGWCVPLPCSRAARWSLVSTISADGFESQGVPQMEFLADSVSTLFEAMCFSSR